MENRDYLSRRKLTATEAATAIRAHWAIKNVCHGSLDVTPGEDASRIAQGYAAENLSLVRRRGAGGAQAACGGEREGGKEVEPSEDEKARRMGSGPPDGGGSWLVFFLMRCARPVYNWSRPRDLSHYKTFEQYHRTFYQHVEALSVTPFASRALDRGLSALLVALVSLSSGRFNGNEKAREIDLQDPMVQRAIDVIVRRAELVEKSKAAKEEVRAMLVARAQQWKAEATSARGKGELSYRVKDGTSLDLLKVAGLGRWEPFTCLGSLRDEEPGVSLILSNGGLDEEPAVTSEEVAS